MESPISKNGGFEIYIISNLEHSKRRDIQNGDEISSNEEFQP